MATTPYPTPKPPEPAKDPNRVKTTAEEQLERSAEMEKEGVGKYMADRDERTDKTARVHPGVHPEKDEPGNTRRR